MVNQSLAFYRENIQYLTLVGSSTEEQETVVNYRRSDEYAYVETTDQTVLTKLKKLVSQNPEEWVIDNITVPKDSTSKTNITSIRVRCPKKYISYRARSIEREITEEQRQALADRLRAARKSALN